MRQNIYPDLDQIDRISPHKILGFVAYRLAISQLENPMTRYFFDVKSRARVEHDFTGRLLATLEQARQFADVVAADLCCMRSDELAGMEVHVRSVEGQLVALLPLEQQAV